MTRPDLTTLILMCGALHDLAEKCADMYSRPQIKEIEKTLESIALNYMTREDKKMIEWEKSIR